MPEDALHKSAAANNENREPKAPAQENGRTAEVQAGLQNEDQVNVGNYTSAAAQSSLKSELLTKTEFDGDLLAAPIEIHGSSATGTPAGTPSPASHGAQTILTRPQAGDWSVGYQPTPLPEELEPSRKIETPDMLRWRAEMLLDEMMVGAVDVSAGDGSAWRTSSHDDASLLLDAHPHSEPRSVSVSPGSSIHTPQPLNAAPTVSNAVPAATPISQTPEVETVSSVDRASVRAALPPRSVTRLPTPIGRNGEHAATTNGQTNGRTGNGGSYANGASNGVNDNAGSNGHSGYLQAEDVTAADTPESASLEGDVADDGRPSAHQNCASTNGASTNGAGAHGENRKNHVNGGSAAPDMPVAPIANGHFETTQSRVDKDSDENPDASAYASSETAMGYSLASTPDQPAPTTRRSTPAPMLDPLEEPNPYPPTPKPAPAPTSSPLRTGNATTQPFERAYGSSTNISANSASYAPSTPAVPTAYTPRNAPTRTEAPTPESAETPSLGVTYSAYAPPPAITPPATTPQTERSIPVAPPSRTEGKGKLVAVEQRYARPIQPEGKPPSLNGNKPGSLAAAGTHNDAQSSQPESITGGLGPVRINPAVLNSASITGAMTVGSRASSRYASLLPRATPWDLHEMEREIVALQEEMARVMPSGHESTRRARHLLEKAQTIFVNDPLRSAEVDYYLTQVKAIVQRSHQTLEWSEMYRKQLVRYHWAWIGFSSLMLSLCIVFGTQLAAWATALFGWSATGMMARNFVPASIAIFAGSLGASVGALVTIRRYHRLELGYFDRKYSLRGLMLPVIGLLGGLIFYGIFSTLHWAMGVDLTLPLVLELLPSAFAFLLGFLQESVYGTRD